MSRNLQGRLRARATDSRRVLPGFAVARAMLAAAGVPDDIVSKYFRAVSTFATRDNVTAIDVGIKLKDHDTDADAGYCVRIHVRDKRARRQIPRSQLIPGRFEGLWTDVIQGEYVEHGTTVVHCDDRKQKLQTLQPGISIGNVRGSAGTLGMFVRGVDEDSNSVYVLSADHVLADVANPTPGDPIIQPGREDGGSAIDAVASLTRRSIIFDAALARYVDDGSRSLTNRVAQTGDLILDSDFADLGTILVKAGSVSCVTQAEVDGIGLFEGLGPGFHLKQVARGLDEGPIAVGGDSGAVWYDPVSSRAVGLHVRGNAVSTPNEQFAIATSVVKLCEALRVEAIL